MTFINVPKDKEHLLSEDEKAQLEAHRNGEDDHSNYGDVITREDAKVVEKPVQRSRKAS